MAKKIDTVTVEVVRNLLMSIAEETYGIIVRSAYSTNMKERRDVCTAVIDPDGNSVAQVESLAALLGSMLSVVPNIYEKFGRENVKPAVYTLPHSQIKRNTVSGAPSQLLRREAQQPRMLDDARQSIAEAETVGQINIYTRFAEFLRKIAVAV